MERGYCTSLETDCAAEMEKAWIEKPLLATARVEIFMCGQDVHCLFDQSSHCLCETAKADGLRQKSIGVR